jgi:Sulfotransferase domain
MSSGETVRDAPCKARRAPDFLLVGHPKCGTTAIYKMLRRHPQVYTVPGMKETGFLDDETPPPPPRSPRPKTLDEYLAVFGAAAPGQRAGEMTTSYLRSRTAPGKIAEVAPDVRIVAIFREPASFLRSLHLQLVHDHVEPIADFRSALALEPARMEGREMPPECVRPAELMYANLIRYREQLERYHAALDPSQVLAIIYDDLRNQNRATLENMLRFIGVDDVASLEVFDAHPSVRVRSSRAQGLLRATVHGKGRGPRAFKRMVMPFTTRRFRQNAFRFTRDKLLYAKPKPPDEELALELKRRFRDEVEAFGDYVGRDLLTLWGYRDLG